VGCGLKAFHDSSIYGIKNCDTMKKPRAFLNKKGIVYDFTATKPTASRAPSREAG
jgi:arsenate reductase-like glutaredoxin family protein